jgi:hypothetical protein
LENKKETEPETESDMKVKTEQENKK